MPTALIKTIIYSLLFCSTTLLAQQKNGPNPLNTIGNLPKPDSSLMYSSIFITNEQPEILSTFRISINTKMRLAAIATSNLGKGKILLIGSSAYFKKPMLNTPEVVKAMDSILSWAKPVKKSVLPLVAVYGNDMGDLVNYIKYRSDSYQFDGRMIMKNTSVIFLTQDITDPVILKNIEQYVRNGGNLVFGSPFGELKWGTPTDNKLSINTLFIKAGLYNSTNPLFNGMLIENRLSADTIPPYLHPVTLLPWLARNDLNDMDYHLEPFAIDPTIKLMFENNELNSSILRQVKATFKYADSVFMPSRKNPVKINNTEERWGYVFNGLLAKKSYLNNPAAKAANYKNFPGDVPEQSPRTKDEEVIIPVRIGTQGLAEPQPTYFRPHSTGFYVPAGERVLITLSRPYLNQGLKAQIGVHDHDVFDLNSLSRDGFDLTKTFVLNKTKTEIYAPYGGLLLICIPDSSLLKDVKFSLTGAVRAPRFDLHKTTEEQWRSTVRNYPAPWAELATENIVLTVPSARIRTLDNPEKLMEFWDKVMDANAELAAISKKRTHPERIIVDSEVAFGYMFTTRQKIVVPDDESCEVMLDLDQVQKEGSWGHFHEIGHRHQFNDLDFSGLTEVSVNLFTLFAYDKVLNKKVLDNEKFPNKQALLKRIQPYLSNSPSFKEWKKDPFLALSMYVQIIDSFGWEPLKNVYTKYREMPREDYPKSDGDKIDLWFTSICDATNTNMTDFFEVWQIPVSETAKEKVRKYKVWLPEEMTQYKKS